MLGFFRRYQRIVFIFVAVIVVVTMTCFGSYYSFRAPVRGEDPVVFTAIDGTRFTRNQMNQMTLFLGSDSVDKRQGGGIWGPNFLNDGIIRYDLLESGLGAMLASEYLDWLAPDLGLRYEREKNFVPYTHAHARFLSAETVWSLYAPKLLKSYTQLKDKSSPNSRSFHDRVALYLEEQRFPQLALKQVLRYQETQYSWIPQDPYLFSHDLSLFGYHNLEDWFGPRFLNLLAEFIINTSIIAQQRGYQVSTAEAWSSLQRNGEQSFHENRQSPYVDVGLARDYIERQLQQMGMDRGAATQIWKRAMLCRRLLDDIGSAPLVDVLSFKKFHHYADQTVELDLYSLSPDLYLPNYASLQAFESYLDCVSCREGQDPAALPTHFRSIDEVKQSAPELVQRRYLLGLRQVNTEALALRIPLRELWDFQLKEENWQRLVEKFPVLASTPNTDREHRLKGLDSLDRQTRHQVDSWTSHQILTSHSDWILEALDAAEYRESEMGISYGLESPLQGLTDSKSLCSLLDAAPIGSTPSDSPLYCYTQNGDAYYRIEVLDRDNQDEILTFAEAMQSGAIETTVQRRLGDKGKSRDGAADREFANLINAVYRTALAQEPTDTQLPDKPTGAYAAKHRFLQHLQTLHGEVLKKGGQSQWLASLSPPLDPHKLSKRLPLADQWKLQRKTVTVHRHSKQLFGRGLPYAMAVDDWSQTLEEEDKPPYFFCVVSKTPGAWLDTHQMDRGQHALATEAQRCYMRQLIATLREHNALSLAHLFPEGV